MAKGQYLKKFGGSKSGFDKGRKSGFFTGVIFILLIGFLCYLIWRIL